MDGYRQLNALVVTAGLSLLGVGFCGGQVPTQPAPPTSGAPAQPPALSRPNPAPRQSGERWRDMSPVDRQRFQSNIERWRQMPPEERRELRQRAGWREERMKRDAAAAIRDAGLQLEAERRAQFEARYLEERKRIEHALRQELREKRQRELAPVVERLKKEFAQPQSSTTPSATGAPSSPAKK